MIYYDEFSPGRIRPRLKSAPRIRQMYWCDFPRDAQLPEFWKTRPVIIVSRVNSLFGAATIVPCTTQNQAGNRWAYRLRTTFSQSDAWAICDKPSTVAVSRLSLDSSGPKRISEDEFVSILRLLYQWLPAPP